MFYDPISVKSRVCATALMAVAIAACSRNDTTSLTAESSASNQQGPASASALKSDNALQKMGVEQLHQAAKQALAKNRIYAPGGDNAVEYYLSLRDKQANDPAVSSALTDLLPYTVIAAEKRLEREELVEAQRLVGLVERVDAQAPALSDLKRRLSEVKRVNTKRQDRAWAAIATANAEKKAHEPQHHMALVAEQKKTIDTQATKRQRKLTEGALELARGETSQKEHAAAVPVEASPTEASPGDSVSVAVAPALRVVDAPAPRYPTNALRTGTSGEVLVEITVGVDGSVSNARVVRAQPLRVFDRESLNAVRRWKFEPVDTPVTTRRTIAFNAGDKSKD